MEMKRIYFVEHGYWNGNSDVVALKTEEHEAVETAKQYWDNATQEMRDNGYYACVETALMPEEDDVECILDCDYVWNHDIDLEGWVMFDKESEDDE